MLFSASIKKKLSEYIMLEIVFTVLRFQIFLPIQLCVARHMRTSLCLSLLNHQSLTAVLKYIQILVIYDKCLLITGGGNNINDEVQAEITWDTKIKLCSINWLWVWNTALFPIQGCQLTDLLFCQKTSPKRFSSVSRAALHLKNISIDQSDQQIAHQSGNTQWLH